jgi:hypothetical protein
LLHNSSFSTDDREAAEWNAGNANGCKRDTVQFIDAELQLIRHARPQNVNRATFSDLQHMISRWTATGMSVDSTDPEFGGLVPHDGVKRPQIPRQAIEPGEAASHSFGPTVVVSQAAGKRAYRATCNPDVSVCNPTERWRAEVSPQVLVTIANRSNAEVVRDMHCCKLGKGISLPNQQRARSIFRRCGQVYLEGNPVEPSPKETTDEGQALGSARVALACAFVSSGAAVALEDKAIEAGKGFAFKNRVFEIKEKGQVAVLLSFAAGR